ncbi:unnamed protein product, partial [Callosobruchus maculatus]
SLYIYRKWDYCEYKSQDLVASAVKIWERRSFCKADKNVIYRKPASAKVNPHKRKRVSTQLNHVDILKFLEVTQ